MSDPVTIKIEGLSALNKRLKKMESGLDRAVLEVNKEAAGLIMWEALQRVPVRSGALAGTIRIKATKTTAAVMAGSTAVPYAPIIHWGWKAHHMAPDKFIYRALDSKGPEVVGLYEKRIAELEEE